MNLNEEAKRIMALSISKLYSSRTQRGGLRLHRSLLLSLVMRSARDIYHSVQVLNETEDQQHTVPCEPQQPVIEEPMDTSTDQTVPEMSIESTETDLLSNDEGNMEPLRTEDGEWDKENRDSNQCDRHSRKRRGKAAAEPEFLPSKKARMDTEDDRRVGVLRNTNGNCCRSVEILTQLSVPNTIEAFWTPGELITGNSTWSIELKRVRGRDLVYEPGTKESGAMVAHILPLGDWYSRASSLEKVGKRSDTPIEAFLGWVGNERSLSQCAWLCESEHAQDSSCSLSLCLLKPRPADKAASGGWCSVGIYTPLQGVTLVFWSLDGTGSLPLVERGAHIVFYPHDVDGSWRLAKVNKEARKTPAAQMTSWPTRTDVVTALTTANILFDICLK